MAVKITVEMPKILKKMKQNAKNAKHQALKKIADKTHEELKNRVPKDTGRAANNIIQIIDKDEAFIGWTDKEIIEYIAVQNYGSTNHPNGWIIRAKGRENGGSDWLIFPATDKYGPYNLPTMKMNGLTFYIAKSVKHPYQKGQKFIEGTVEEIRNIIDQLVKQSYVNALKGGDKK